MMQRLSGKRALITGATSGIGLETAKAFQEQGARVAITARSEAHFEAARKILGDSAICLVSDASDVNAQRQLAEQVRAAMGGLDVLFLNAGVAELRPASDWTPEQFDRVFSINLRGPFFLIQALLPVFANPASIVLNASINAHVGMPNSSVYGASKAALLSLARTLSGELIGRGIRVNSISPGPIATPLYDKLGLSKADLAATAEAIRNLVPVKRFGTPSEIASAAVYLASDESAFVVGSDLVIAGGMGL